MTTEFLPLADGVGANVVSQAEYEAMLDVGGPLVNGYLAGLAYSNRVNKTLRQATVVGHALTSAVSAALGVNIVDDGDLAALISQVTRGLQYAQRLGYVVDSGAANAYVVALVPAVTAYVNGMTVRFKATNANSGASTLNAGGGAKSIKSNVGAALASGDIPAGSVVAVIFDTVADAWLLLGISLSQSQAVNNGQCVLTKSGANLLLSPFNGNKILVNGTALTIPDAGVTLAVGAALTEGGIPVASTTYYIYAYNNAGAVALQASGTGHSAQAGTGLQIRTGDATRTLVGMARTSAAPAWVSSGQQAFVRSWYNSPAIPAGKTFASNYTTTSLTYVEISSAERVEFLSWADEGLLMMTSGRMGNGIAGGQDVALSIGIDGTSPITFSRGGNGTTSSTIPASCICNPAGIAEGYHYATTLGYSSAGGTCTWYGTGVAGESCILLVTMGGT